MTLKRICEYCGINNNPSQIPTFRAEYGQTLCYKCYTHHKEHPINEIPKKGHIKYDIEGRVICHICGRAYDRLTAHIKSKHKVSKEDYLKEFGLNRTQKLTSEKHRKKIRDSATTLDNIEKYRNTTLNIKGNTHPRANKKTRLQGILNMRIARDCN